MIYGSLSSAQFFVSRSALLAVLLKAGLFPLFLDVALAAGFYYGTASGVSIVKQCHDGGNGDSSEHCSGHKA